MIKKLKLFAALFACALFSAGLALSRAASADSLRPASLREAGRQQQQQQQRGLTPQESRGKAIYLRGESPSGREIAAMVADVNVPTATVTCAGCHGPRGEGKTEGGVTAGNLTWSNLLKPHTHPSRRKHAPFDEASFARAVTGGVDPDGNELAVAMPRYRISAEDLADLVAYLKRIETEGEPGLSESEIKVGTLSPRAGPLSETGAAMREVLAAYFDDVNGRGGIYGRRLVLRAAEGGADAAATAASARRLAEQEQVFAFVGGMSAGADRELAALAREIETPFVGPSTLLPQTSAPANRQVFYLLPGLGEQARALVNFAATKPELKTARVFVAHPGGELAEAAAAAVEDQAAKSGLKPVAQLKYARAGFDARQLVQKLKAEQAAAVFFFGAGGEEAAFIREAAAAGWTPHVFLLGALTSSDLVASVPPAFKEKVFLAFPTAPSDITAAGLAEFGALREKYKLAARHTAAQLAAFAAAKIFVEGLRRAGQDLSRERLITSLEGLYEYETGVTPRVSYGPNRRVGAAGANVMKIDPDKKEFAPAGGWVKAY